MPDEIFKEKVYKHIRRIIGFIDTDENSPTFGCADRYYWHYKLKDYYNARFQEVSLVLAFFYLDKDAYLYKNEKLFGLIRGVINFYIKNLNRNGSVNEIFPHEQSFCATSFSAYIITETLNLLNLDNEKKKYKKELEKVGDWLSKNENWHIANQVAASAITLYNIGKICGNEKFLKESDRRVKILLNNFKKDGYFKEYGGFDLGYNTLSMSLLAQLYLKTKDKELINVIKLAEKHVEKFLDKYADYDNIKMSRNTNFIYPFSFKVLKSPILEKIITGLKEDRILNPDWLDDRYLIGLSNDYLITYYK